MLLVASNDEGLFGGEQNHFGQETDKENQGYRGQDEAQARVAFLLFRGCGHDVAVPS